MKRLLQILAALVLLGLLAILLVSQRSATVEGVLEYHSPNVRSVEAWLGHEFLIGDTPILPTAEVSAEELKKLVGENVRIKGIWKPGKEVEPSPDDQFLQKPQGFERKVVGEGFEAASIQKL